MTMMPVHQQPSNGQPTKPLLPALSSRFRATKSPITPKLAVSPHTSPALSRLSPDRETRPNITSITREDNSPLSANITPRSGNRRSRIGTDSPATPTSITSTGPKRARAVSGSKAGTEAAMNGSGLGIRSPALRPHTAARVLQNNPNSASSPDLSRRVSNTKSAVGSEVSSATSPFFHADDAKSSISSYDAPERPNLGPKAASFFYVGGGNITASPDPTRSNSSSSPRPDASKFFHANDLPQSSPKNQPTRPALNKKKSAASIRSPRLQSPDLPRLPKSPSRPASPLKETSYRSAPPALQSPTKSKATATPVLTARIDAARRTSVGSNVSSPRQTLHKKSSSTSVLPNAFTDNNTFPSKSKHAALLNLQGSPKQSQRQRLSRDMALPEAGSPQATTTITTATNPIPVTIMLPAEPSPITSPTLSSYIPSETSKPPPTAAQEAATNARRQRKVLDLEISNSSLLAINRTLEREMRKQSAELRRFRRLSRSGRLSIRTVSGQSKSSLGVLAEDGEDEDQDQDQDAQALLNGLDEMDLGESDEDASASDEDSSFSPTASESASNSNLSSTHALKQRKRDEKRLMLDLSKHRQLLIDSEKMSSSIRRCLAWSEEMIKDGQRALEHQVRVGDVKLGGRVLERDDDDSDEEQRGMGLVSPSRVLGKMEAERLWADAERDEAQAVGDFDNLKDARDETMSPFNAPVALSTSPEEGFDDFMMG